MPTMLNTATTTSAARKVSTFFVCQSSASNSRTVWKRISASTMSARRWSMERSRRGWPLNAGDDIFCSRARLAMPLV